MRVATSDLSRSVVFSILTCVLGTALAVAVNFATEKGAGLAPWVAVVALTVLSAALAFLVHPKRQPESGWPSSPATGGYPGSGGYPPSTGHPGPGGHPGQGGYPGQGGQPPPWAPGQHPPQGYPGGQQAKPGWAAPPARPRRTVPLVAALLVIALIVGGAGGVAYGGWYAVGWITGNQQGQDVLVREVSATEGPLTLTVHAVEITRHFTKLEVTAANQGRASLSLVLYGSCQLDTGGATHAADPFRSNWNDTVAAGGSVRGTITFNGKPAEGARSVTLTFARVFGSFEVQSITVPDIPIRSPG